MFFLDRWIPDVILAVGGLTGMYTRSSEIIPASEEVGCSKPRLPSGTMTNSLVTRRELMRAKIFYHPNSFILVYSKSCAKISSPYVNWISCHFSIFFWQSQPKKQLDGVNSVHHPLIENRLCNLLNGLKCAAQTGFQQ